MRDDSGRPSDRRFWWALALLLLAVSAAYGSVLFTHYAYQDDFLFLHEVRSPTLREKLPPLYNVQGRWLGGVITQALFRAAWTYDGLDRVRAALFALALLCGAILAAEFRRVAPWWVGLGAVSLLLLSPGVAVFVAWTSCEVLSLPSATLALLGGVGWRRAFERGGVRTLRFWLEVVGGGILALAALLIYQPCACFFLLPAAIRLLDRDNPRGALRAGVWTAGGFTLVCAGYFATFQLVRPYLRKSDDLVLYRADTVRDVAGRLWFYLTDVLPRSFESWTAFAGAWPQVLAVGAGVVLLLPFLVRLARTPGGASVRWQALLVAPLLFGLASSPLLVVRDSYAPFRTLAVLYGLIVVGVAGSVVEIAGRVPARRRAVRAALAVGWAGLIAANGVAAAYVTKEGLVMRSVRELRLYRRCVRCQLADGPKEVIVLLPYPQDIPRLCRIAPQHEFGTASSSVDWSFPGLLECALADEHVRAPSDAETLIHTLPTDGPTLFPANVPVVDAARVLQGIQPGDAAPRSGAVAQDGFFGEVQQITPALRWSRWFGLHEVLSPTSIRHRELGTLDLAGAGGEDCWLHGQQLGWFWTNPGTFPFLLSGEHKHWLWYVRGTRRPAEIYDFDAPGHPRVPSE